jgi:cytochrome c-type biogenesis protein
MGSLDSLLQQHPLVALPIVFGGGVVASLTPCIYPMIPVTVAIIGGSATAGDGQAPTSRTRIVALTLAYAVGLAVVYASLGLLAGITGTIFGSISTNPWFSFLLANLLVLFGLMVIDVVPVPIPPALLDWAASIRSRGRLIGAAGMGAASGIVVAPCGAPVMATVLTWIATTRSAGLGFLYLFVFSMGMSTLLIVVGLFSGSVARLPRAGPWMVWVKRAFAAMTLVGAEYYLVHMGGLLT